jgi:BolA protein
MTSTADTIHAILATHFQPLDLAVTDDSAKHAGHVGARPGGQTHFSVMIVSAAFDNLAPVARHRLIYDALGEQFKGGLHALVIRALTPKEAEKIS